MITAKKLAYLPRVGVILTESFLQLACRHQKRAKRDQSVNYRTLQSAAPEKAPVTSAATLTDPKTGNTRASELLSVTRLQRYDAGRRAA